MFEPTLNLFSRYVSMVGSKRRYHSSRVCVDVAGTDSCRVFLQCFYTNVAKTSISNSVESEPLSPANFHKPGLLCSSAATRARFLHVEIF